MQLRKNKQGYWKLGDAPERLGSQDQQRRVHLHVVHRGPQGEELSAFFEHPRTWRGGPSKGWGGARFAPRHRAFQSEIGERG